MAERKFDLLVCCFPGGYSYTNKAVTEHGDYKKVAFIDHYGHLKFYVPVSYIPDNVLLRIDHEQSAIAANFRKEWDAKTDIKKFTELCDMCPLHQFVKMPRDGFTFEEKIDYLEYAVFGWVPHSEKVAYFCADNNITPRKW